MISFALPGRIYARRLRDIYRSAGWPCQDAIEVELLAAGLLERSQGEGGAERVRLTDAGIASLAQALGHNKRALSAHDALVDRIALSMQRDGRVVWTHLSLRARLPPLPAADKPRWKVCKPDVFSIRNTSVAEYVDPIVHEIKVRRSDLLGDLRRPEKRAAYLDLGGECWYVLGCDAKDRCIAEADEVPAECGVMVVSNKRLVVARAAPRHTRQQLPFGVWIALAKATPLAGLRDDEQGLLGDTEAGLS